MCNACFYFHLWVLYTACIYFDMIILCIIHMYKMNVIMICWFSHYSFSCDLFHIIYLFSHVIHAQFRFFPFKLFVFRSFCHTIHLFAHDFHTIHFHMKFLIYDSRACGFIFRCNFLTWIILFHRQSLNLQMMPHVEFPYAI